MSKTRTTAAVATPGITEPDNEVTQDFSQPITFRWDRREIPETDVLGWWLCVGTLETKVEEGDWNILSGDMRRNTHLTIDVSDRWKDKGFKGLRVQLLCSVKDHDLDPPERTMVLDPIEFVSNKFATVLEVVSSIADEKKKKAAGHQSMHMPH